MITAYLIALTSATVGQTTQVSYAGTFTAGLQYPARVAMDGGGGLYVTDPPSNQVVHLDAAGALIAAYDIAETPVGIASHSNGNIYIARGDGAVGVYDAAFTEIGTLDPAPTTMTAPNDIAVHPVTGEIYVVDGAQNHVLVFDPGTALLNRMWGMAGVGLGQLMSPQSIAIDPALDHVIVTDADNFRVQVFDTAGLLQFRFGYRILFTATSETAWFARVEGVAVDSCSNIYLTDALMGTVRAFDYMGNELDPANTPLVGFGAAAGELRVPCDVMIDGLDRMYVASYNNAAVEVYDLTCTPATIAATASATTSPRRTTPSKTKGSIAKTVDNPYDIVEAMASGTVSRALDLNNDRRVNFEDLEIAVAQFDAATVDHFTGGIATAFEGAHIVDIPNQCGRCHSMDGLPDGMLSVTGQENLCLSCHQGGGVAKNTPISGVQTGDNHPWGMAATSGGVNGPDPDSVVAIHLDNGDVRCGSCHDQHTQENGMPYLRGTIGNANLCGECHEEAAQWRNAGHADETAEAFVHYDWSQPNRAVCRQCHSGNGYIDWAEGFPAAEQDGSFRVVDCLVCHGAHGVPQSDVLLRTFDEVTLPTEGPDVTLTGLGAQATCYACHNGRRAPDDGSLTPHYMLGAVMLEGLNGNDFGYTLVNSQHTNLEASCVSCHMSEGPAQGEPGHGKLGEHTFAMKVHDPEDPDFGAENLSGCNVAACHGGTGPLTTLNRTAYGDYDGDGVIEGVQDEVAGLEDLVFPAIEAKGAVFLGHYPYWDLSGVDPAEEQLVRDAIWNWEYVDNAGDLGVKNTAYAVGLLQVTYKVLTGGDVPNAELRYVVQLSEPNIAVQSVNGGTSVEPGQPWSVDFTITDDNGDPFDINELNRLRIYVSGPATNYQIVLPRDGDLGNFVQNGDGSFTYTPVDPFPTVYSAPLNDSPDITEGELTGQALLDGTYTVLIESRMVYNGVRKAGDATFDFVVANDPLAPPALQPREFVRRDVCNDCHLDLQIHGSNRFAVSGCVICHTTGSEDYITDPVTTPGLTVKFGDMIHKVHRGHALRKIEATANGADPYHLVYRGHNGNPADFSEVGFPILPMSINNCDACHEGSLQAAEIFTSPTRAGCGGCHDDMNFTTGTILDQTHPDVQAGTLTQAQLSDPAFRTFPEGVDHTAAGDGFCAGCHGPGQPEDALVAHQHPTLPAQEGTDPVFDIVAVGGMTGGGGTYFLPGDFPEITFRLSDLTADPLEIVPGDSSVLDRVEIVLSGPTTLYQTIISSQRPWSGGNLAVPAGNWIDNFAVDGTYTFISEDPIPADYPPQLNTIGEPPADQIFPFADGWGQQYTPGGTPLDNGTYTVFAWGRRVTPVAGEREPFQSDQFDIPFGSADPLVPYGDLSTTASCNACHGELAFHGFQREGLETCLSCHTAGTQDGGTFESVDFRVMPHKLHNARNLTNLPYELNGFFGIADFSALLISAMPGEAAECEACHTTDAWYNPPVRTNMRTWMTACTSCHDSVDTANHVDAQTVPGTFEELCALCHGQGALFAVQDVHASP